MGKQIKPQKPFSRVLRSFTFPLCVGYTAVEKPPCKRQKPSNKGRKEVNHGMADDTSEALKIWEALRPMIDTEIAEKTRSCVRTRKMVCTTAPNGSVIGVAEPFGNEVKIPYSSSVSNAQVGDAVWVQWYYDNASTMLAISFGDGSSQKYLPLTGGTVTGPITNTYDGTGMGINAIAPSGAIGYLAKNSTTNKSVSMQVGSGGSNRGIYDSSGDKWMIYCDSSNRLRFSGANATTRSDLGISSLIDHDASASATWLSAADTYFGSQRTLVFYRRGNMILFRTNINLLAKSLSSTTLGTIPEGFRPTTAIYNSGALQSSLNTFYLGLSSNGNIAIGHYGSPLESGFLRITGCYPL